MIFRTSWLREDAKSTKMQTNSTNAAQALRRLIDTFNVKSIVSCLNSILTPFLLMFDMGPPRKAYSPFRKRFIFLFVHSFLNFDFTLFITQLFCTNSVDLIGSARLLGDEIASVSNHEEAISYSRTIDHLLPVRVKKNKRPRCLRDL